jgi:hypothetical protein
VYLLFWGPSWSTTGTDYNYLTSFISGLGREPSDDWSTIMEQYGVPAGYPNFTGSVLRGVYVDSTTPPYGATQSQLAAEADALYASQSLTDATNTQIVIATQSGTCPAGFYSPTCDPNGNYCAWHSYTSVHSVPYTSLPYLLDAGRGCGEDYVNPAPQGNYDGFSIVEGHEYAETVTDPLINAWSDYGDPYGGEIGDKCAWRNLFNLTLTTGTFAMQPLWSNAANACAQHATVGVPGTPTIGTATAGDRQATVAFSAPASDGGATISSYTVIAHDATNSSRGGQTASGSQSPITITGLTDGDSYSFTVTATNVNGSSPSSATSNTVIPQASSVGAPGQPTYHFYTPSRLTSGGTPLVPEQTQWTASSTTGVSYELQEQVNGGAWTTVYTGTALQFQTQLAFNSTYDFRVRSTLSGTASGWVANTAFTVVPYPESAMTFTGTWTSTSNTQLWGGIGKYTKAANAAASLSFNGRTFAIIGNKGPGNGSAKLYVDGVAKSTMNEHATGTSYRNIVGQWGWPSTGSHTVKIANLATSGHPRFDVDGIVVFQ